MPPSIQSCPVPGRRRRHHSRPSAAIATAQRRDRIRVLRPSASEPCCSRNASQSIFPRVDWVQPPAWIGRKRPRRSGCLSACDKGFRQSPRLCRKPLVAGAQRRYDATARPQRTVDDELDAEGRMRMATSRPCSAAHPHRGEQASADPRCSIEHDSAARPCTGLLFGRHRQRRPARRDIVFIGDAGLPHPASAGVCPPPVEAGGDRHQFGWPAVSLVSRSARMPYLKGDDRRCPTSGYVAGRSTSLAPFRRCAARRRRRRDSEIVDAVLSARNLARMGSSASPRRVPVCRKQVGPVSRASRRAWASAPADACNRAPPCDSPSPARCAGARQTVPPRPHATAGSRVPCARATMSPALLSSGRRPSMRGEDQFLPQLFAVPNGRRQALAKYALRGIHAAQWRHGHVVLPDPALCGPTTPSPAAALRRRCSVCRPRAQPTSGVVSAPATAGLAALLRTQAAPIVRNVEFAQSVGSRLQWFRR